MSAGTTSPHDGLSRAPRTETFAPRRSATDARRSLHSVRRDGRRRFRPVFFHYYVGGISQPTASVGKVLVQMTHHEVDGAAMCVAGEAAVSVPSHVECQAGMMVVMEGAEALVPRHAQPQPLRPPSTGSWRSCCIVSIFIISSEKFLISNS